MKRRAPCQRKKEERKRKETVVMLTYLDKEYISSIINDFNLCSRIYIQTFDVVSSVYRRIDYRDA